MKKLLAITFLFLAFAACQNEPKLNNQEETAVQNQMNMDQKAMDSLEKAIKEQMEELDSDSADTDSL